MSQWKNKRYLVTGASGFIGRHLIESLLKEGVQVRLLLKPSSSYPSSWDARVEIHLDVLPSSIDALEKACRDCDTVVHLAGLVNAHRDRDFEQINVESTKILIQAGKKAGVSKWVMCSSLEARGPEKFKPEETCGKGAPITRYGQSKLKAEQCFVEAGLLEHTSILRPCAVYGPSDRGFLPLFQIAQRGWQFYLGPQPKRLSMLYIEDLIKAFLLTLQSDHCGLVELEDGYGGYTWQEFNQTLSELFEITSPKTLHLPHGVYWAASQMGDLISSFSGKTLWLNSRRYPSLIQNSWLCSCAKAQAELGFTPSVSLKSGLSQTLAWYKKEAWL